MKPNSTNGRSLLGVFIGACLVCSAGAQETQVSPGSAPPPTTPQPKQGESANLTALPAKPEGAKPEPKPGEGTQVSRGVDEILKMLQAGVSTNVTKAYIESSAVAYNLSAEDLIALKKRAVPDELTTAMVERGAKLRAQAVQPGNLKALPVVYSGRIGFHGGLDPESYDYFQYYYLYPRTLADANQRLYAPYNSHFGFAPYGYGGYGPMGFRPFAPYAFR